MFFVGGPVHGSILLAQLHDNETPSFAKTLHAKGTIGVDINYGAAVVPNQCEVSYINQILRLWRDKRKKSYRQQHSSRPTWCQDRARAAPRSTSRNRRYGACCSLYRKLDAPRSFVAVARRFSPR